MKDIKPHKHDELYQKEFKTKENPAKVFAEEMGSWIEHVEKTRPSNKKKPHLCDTCRHQIRGMQNGCRAGIHELGLVWQCMSYEYYGPSRQDIDEALKDAGNTKQNILCITCKHNTNNPPCGKDTTIHNDGDCTQYEIGCFCKQVGGDHYSKHKFQVWDIVDEYQLNFYEGNILKYLLRRKGDRVEDLKKAKHYLEKLIERQSHENSESISP